MASSLVSSALDEDIQYGAILIDCPPQILRLTVDLQNQFVQKSLVSRSCSSTSEFISVGLAEHPRPLSDRFIGHDDTALSQEFLDVTIAKAKAEVEPNRVRDDFLWKAKTAIR